MNSKAAIEHHQQELDERGFTLVRGIIPPDTVKRAVEALWKRVGADPGDRGTWTGIRRGPEMMAEPALTACYTPEVLATAARLAGVPDAGFRPPEQACSLHAFPSDGEWKMPGPHIDHSIRADNYKAFPPPFHIASIAYLGKVEPQGGATVVWPGSHRLIEQRARENPREFEFMWQLNQEVPKMDLGEPVEVPAEAGDILFYHYLLAHAGSKNVSERPRFALNMKW